jgi:hypothetical protein
LKYLYVCPKCKTVDAMESDLPNPTVSCTACDVQAIYLQCTKEEWDQKTSSEKIEHKEAVIKQRMEELTSPNYVMLERIGKIESHLSVIKGILIFFTVSFILGGLIIMLINLL